MATKRKPTPAQIAARERFAAMARSGAFKKKARKKNPMVISKQADESLSRQGSRGYVRKLLDRYSDEGHVVSVKKTRSGSIGIAFDGGRMLTVASARKKLEDHYGITDRMGRRSNPMQFYEVINTVTGENEGTVKAADYKLAFDVFARKNGYKNFAEMKQKEKLASNEYLMTETKRRSNPRASNPIILVSDKAIATKRKRNPQAPSIKHKGARNIAYAVEAKRMIAGGGAQFEMIAGFPTKAQAQDYIDALLKSYPKGLTLRISAA